MSKANLIPKNILEVFPNAKYVESEHFDIEDDSIELTSKLSIQVDLIGNWFSLVQEEQCGLIFRYLAISTDLNEVYRKAIEVATCASLN